MTGADLDYVQPYGVKPLRNVGARDATPRQIERARAAAEQAGVQIGASLAALRQASRTTSRTVRRDG
jgi:hypothetical protein